jgi:hypothetical protein
MLRGARTTKVQSRRALLVPVSTSVWDSLYAPATASSSLRWSKERHERVRPSLFCPCRASLPSVLASSPKGILVLSFLLFPPLREYPTDASHSCPLTLLSEPAHWVRHPSSSFYRSPSLSFDAARVGERPLSARRIRPFLGR